jgi:DNA-binding CsgD family transcriptional regulator
MKFKSYNPKKWKIPRDLERHYSPKKIEEELTLFDWASQSNFFIIDYHAQKMITSLTSPASLFGQSKQLIETDGYNFYKRMVNRSELGWMYKMNEDAHILFYSYPESERRHLELSYDLIAKTKDKRPIVLHNKLVPYQLDDNGNLWLALGHTRVSNFQSVFCKASVVNINTGENFYYIDDKFVPSEVKTLTPEEMTILTCAAKKDMQIKQICDEFGISESTLKRKRVALLNKLNVKTMGAAIYKATALRII